MVELALHFNQGILQISDISERAKVPKNYLEQLLNTLKKAGLIQSLRGNKGGYRLSISPDKISINDILQPLEGQDRVSQTKFKNDAISNCYKQAEVAIKTIFSISLSELAQEQQKQDNQHTFYI